jgi:hypothetical protein
MNIQVHRFFVKITQTIWVTILTQYMSHSEPAWFSSAKIKPKNFTLILRILFNKSHKIYVEFERTWMKIANTVHYY